MNTYSDDFFIINGVPHKGSTIIGETSGEEEQLIHLNYS